MLHQETLEPGTALIEIPYLPREQFEPLHNRPERFYVGVAHRRCGKTVACINELVKSVMSCVLVDPRFAYVAPTFTQAKDVAWTYLKRFSAPIPGIVINESELRIDYPNGGRIRLYGAENYDRMRGIYLDGVVLDEYGMMDPQAWQEVIRPALSDRQGWAIFIGTPAGLNHFADLWRNALDMGWGRLLLKASQTGILPKAELEDARRSMTKEQYDAEYECSFEAPVQGSYYGTDIVQAESDGRVSRVPVERGHQVHTAWDLGIGDSTAIWLFQTVGMEVRVIDYIENHGVGLDWYVAQLHNRGHIYGTHLLPHDVEVRELGTGKSRLETLRSLGIEPVVVQKLGVDDGVNAARMLLPRCWFDKEKTARGIEALRNYRRDYDAKRKVFKNAPMHDWSSHGADAFRYLAIGIGRTSVRNRPLRYDNRGIV